MNTLLKYLINNYFGFKFLSSFSLLISILYLLIYFSLPNVIERYDTLLLIMIQYCFVYWIQYYLFGLIILLAFVNIYIFDPLKFIHRIMVRQEFVKIHDSDKYLSKIKKANFVNSLFIIPLIFVTIPMLHINFQAYIFYSVFVFPSIIIISAYLTRFGINLPIFKSISSINMYNYKLKSFNVASTSTISEQSKKEIEYYNNLTAQGGKKSDLVNKYIFNGSQTSLWLGYDVLFKNIAKLLGQCNPYNITLFDSTSQAIRHALEEIKQFNPDSIIFYTDSEYDTTKSSITTLFKDTHHEIPIYEIIEGDVDSTHIVEFIKNAINDVIKNKIENNNTYILVISHIFFKSGYFLDLQILLNSLQDNDIIILIDGAQSLGQIQIKPDIINNIHYYAGCTHKWLLGKEHLGILYRNTTKLSDKKIQEVSSIRGLSKLSFDESNDDFSSTVNIESYISAGVSINEIITIGIDKIEQHCKTLKEIFKRGIRHRNLGLILTENTNSVLTVKLSKPNDRIQILKRNNIYPEFYKSDKLCRFSFHFYHSDQDINDLLDLLDDNY